MDDAFARKYVVHGDGEYADDDVHINKCESHGSLLRPWLSPHQVPSKDKLKPYLEHSQLRRKFYRNQAKKHSLAFDGAL